jgi:DNA-binding NarL/FixJ family response regulator
MSAWDDSPLSEAIREKKLVAGPIDFLGQELDVIAIPFVTHGVPVGLLAVVIEDKNYQIQALQEASELFFKLGAFYLESLDLGNTMNSGIGQAPASPEDLSTRQLTILSHIQDGLVNLEIAKELMLSESTIRQETVRIYRALGVGNRQEAVKKARTLGLINKRPLPLGF